MLASINASKTFQPALFFSLTEQSSFGSPSGSIAIAQAYPRNTHVHPKSTPRESAHSQMWFPMLEHEDKENVLFGAEEARTEGEKKRDCSHFKFLFIFQSTFKNCVFQ